MSELRLGIQSTGRGNIANGLKKLEKHIGEEEEGKKKKRRKLCYILPDDIVRSELNDFQITDEKIEELKNNIRLFGLITPLCLHKQEDGTYEIISGETRYNAIQKGIKEELEEFEEFRTEGIECLVVEGEISDEEKQSMIDSANIINRYLSKQDIREKAERLIKNLKIINEKNGTTESVTKRAAEMLKITERQVQRINRINNGLIEKLKKAFDENKISYDKATMLAGLEDEEQEAIAEILEKSKDYSSKMIEAAKQEVKIQEEQLKKQINEVAEQKKKMEERVKDLELKLQQKAEEIKDTKPSEDNNEIEELKKQKRDAEREKEAVKKELKEKEQKIDQLQKDLQQRKSLKENLDAEERAKIKRNFELEEMKESFKSLIGKVERYAEAETSKEELKELKEKLEKIIDEIK